MMKTIRDTLLVLMLVFINAGNILAHCDGLDGPVVKAAQKALETGDVNLVLIWVKKNDEATIQKVFEETIAVRKLSPHAKDLVDKYFFETLVRLHRAGEGAPYTGLKAAERDLGPALPAADKALQTGSMDELSKLITETVKKGLQQHFQAAMSSRNFSSDNTEAGRKYVEDYVLFIHYVERLYESAERIDPGHYPETGEQEQ